MALKKGEGGPINFEIPMRRRSQSPDHGRRSRCNDRMDQHQDKAKERAGAHQPKDPVSS